MWSLGTFIEKEEHTRWRWRELGWRCIEKSNGMTRYGRLEWLMRLTTKFVGCIGFADLQHQKRSSAFYCRRPNSNITFARLGPPRRWQSKARVRSPVIFFVPAPTTLREPINRCITPIIAETVTFAINMRIRRCMYHWKTQNHWDRVRLKETGMRKI